MKPDEALRRIDAAPHSFHQFRPFLFLKSAWSEICIAAATVGSICSALVALKIIVPPTRALAVLLTVTAGAVLALALLVRKSVRAAPHRVRPTIHLDRDPAQHTIDQHFKRFTAQGDILILQTWIPDSRWEAEGFPGVPRIERWKKYLEDALADHKETAAPEIRLRVLLLGSEEVLRNRVRYRWDLAHANDLSYPLVGADLQAVVNKMKMRINAVHHALLDTLQSGLQAYLVNQAILSTFKVSVRYYRVTPCSPIYIFGQQALLTGFYDHRWTSDRAPAVRLDNPRSAEWIHFQTQFECIWELPDTTREPDWPLN